VVRSRNVNSKRVWSGLKEREGWLSVSLPVASTRPQSENCDRKGEMVYYSGSFLAAVSPTNSGVGEESIQWNRSDFRLIKGAKPISSFFPNQFGAVEA